MHALTRLPPTAQDANLLRLRLPCAVDSYEFTALPENVEVGQVEPKGTETDQNGNLVDQRGDPILSAVYEHKPHFHEWATALPGMICVSRKARNSTFRNYVAAETATPVRSRLEHSYANRA